MHSQKRYFIIVLLCLLFLLTFTQGESPKWGKKTETYHHYLKIGELWKERNCRQLQKLLAVRVTLHLGPCHSSKKPRQIQGRYSKEQAVGILKSYFEGIRIISLRYFPKKMRERRAVALYRYKVPTTGKVKQKLLYIHLGQEKKKGGRVDWVIESIQVAG